MEKYAKKYDGVNTKLWQNRFNSFEFRLLRFHIRNSNFKFGRIRSNLTILRQLLVKNQQCIHVLILRISLMGRKMLIFYQIRLICGKIWSYGIKFELDFEFQIQHISSNSNLFWVGGRETGSCHATICHIGKRGLK